MLKHASLWLTLPVVALCALAGWLFPLLWKLGSRALCYADSAGLHEALFAWTPGGLLQWCASGIAACWAVPWVGLTLLLLLGIGITALAWFWARLPLWAAPLPFAMTLLLVTYCGFAAWLHPNPAFPVQTLLVFGVILFLLGLAQRWAWTLLPAFLLYPLVGSALPVGMLFCVTLPRMRLWLRIALVVLSCACPILWKFYCEADPAWHSVLFPSLPVLFEDKSLVWNLLLAGACVLLLGAFWIPVRFRLAWFPQIFLGGLAVVYATLFFCVSDRAHPLRDIIACERALEQDDIATLLAVPTDRVVNHRMLSAYTIYALWRSGQLEERLFTYPWRVSHQETTINTMALDGYNLLYRYGLVLIARRWCYESVISLGWTPDKYRLMARTALITGEPLLAERYARQLRRLPFRKAEADKLLTLCRDFGKTLPDDQELLRVADLYNRLSADTGSPVFENAKRLEVGIYNRYAVLKNGNRDMVALYLCSSLLRKDPMPLVENFDVVLQQWPERPLPLAFQEGLLSAASTLPPARQPHLTQDLFSPEKLKDFESFRALSKNASTYNLLLPFRCTYWFYAACVP